MTAVLDAILGEFVVSSALWFSYLILTGYWRLVNLGILHRDISDGNVTMLAPGQKFEWKEWMENHSGKSKTTNPILAESEEKLREILSKLDRNPTGILSDFDLHAKHTSAVLPEVAVGPTGAPIGRSAISFLDSGAPGTVGSHVANVLGKDDLVETPTSKRRKTNSGSSIASISHTAPETGSRGLTSCSERVSKLEEGKQRLVDFRTVSNWREIRPDY